jgi:methylated-DNA-[protein]-cysteine S-methyltransferase
MRNSTKPAEASPALREETYATRFGVGRLVLAGDLPVEHDLPDVARAELGGASPGRWSGALEAYFAGERVAFDLDLRAWAESAGCTTFETAVYEALATVPYGEAVSYRDLAVMAGHPNAYRAVGSVMARNPLPVLLPCHRVVRSDGHLGQYGDDPAWKARLLELEGAAVTDGRLAASVQ